MWPPKMANSTKTHAINILQWSPKMANGVRTDAIFRGEQGNKMKAKQ